MQIDERNCKSRKQSAPKPYLMAGAGPLASSIWKKGSEETGWEYRFNFFKLLRGGGVTQQFRPADLEKIVKLVHLMARVLIDDGCLEPRERELLSELRDALDHVAH